MNYIFTESKREEIRYTYENGKIKQVKILYKGNNDGDKRKRKDAFCVLSSCKESMIIPRRK